MMLTQPLVAVFACSSAIVSAAILPRQTKSASEYSSDPQHPPLIFLYEMFAETAPPIVIENSPSGTRAIYPIVGGSFNGPKCSGTVSDLGADWGLDSGSARLYPDTKYNLVMEDGSNVYIRTQGSYQPDMTGHLAAKYGASMSGKYDWLNDVTGYGVIEDVISPKLNISLAVCKTSGNSVLRIRMWHYQAGVPPTPNP